MPAFMLSKQTLFYSIFILFLSSFFVSCKKDKFLTEGGQINYSIDTLKFDTVFTTLGSATRSFLLYNTNNKRIKIDEIKLQGGQNSPFRLNVDGEPTKDIHDVEIAPNDSIYIFVAVTVNPSTGNLPFIVNDKVEVTLNGNQSSVALQAYGQDAHYVVHSFLQTAVWDNDKPYVIIHSAAVDTGETLTINKGCRIYMHADSKLYVAGRLWVFGTKEDSVIFQGDRLDRDYFGYKDYPGEWRGIHFLRCSEGSNLNYAIIKNAGLTDAAVYVEPPTVPLAGPQLEMNQCIIANSSGFGIIGLNTWIKATNCLIHTCGLQNLAILEGGTYEFNYCTIATFGGLGINHAQQPSAVIYNYRDTSLTGYVGNNLQATFQNCIFYGSLDDEIIFNQKGTWNYQVTMTNCLLKRATAVPSTMVTMNNCITNTDADYPQFIDSYKWDFHLKSTSPLKQKGLPVPAVDRDLDRVLWNNPPSIGCYEVN
jgi:hypothetical protein